MRRLAVFASIALGAAALLPAAGRAGESGQRVHRCIGRGGEIVFSGLPCTAEGAASAGVAPPAPAVSAAACPASREELRAAVGAAIARRDANALAGLVRWSGIGRGGAGARMRTLRELAQRPLLAIEDAQTAEAAGAGFRVRTGSSGDAGGLREQAFGVESAGGCFWLAW